MLPINHNVASKPLSVSLCLSLLTFLLPSHTPSLVCALRDGEHRSRCFVCSPEDRAPLQTLWLR